MRPVKSVAPKAMLTSPPLPAAPVLRSRLAVPLAVITALTLMLRWAERVSLLALHDKALLTWMSPDCPVVSVAEVAIVTLLDASAFCSVAAPTLLVV